MALGPAVDNPFSMSETITAGQGQPGGTRASRADLKKYLINEHGLTSAGADGMLRNAYDDESGGDPDAVGDGGTSFGLFQHHNERATELGEYASKHGKKADDPYAQIDFAVNEMETKFPGLYKKLQTTKDESEAHDDFRRIFERPASLSGLGKGSVSFSDYAMNEPRDENTDVHMMSPDDYLNMSPPMDRPWQDKSGQSLLKSLKAGDPIEQIPSLKVDDGGTVTDQDGRHRALAAKDSGLDEIPVAIERPGPKPIPSQMTGMTGKTMATPEARPAQTPNRGIMDWLVPGASAAETVPGAFKSAAMPQQQPTPDQQAPGTAPSAQAQQTHIAGQQASTGATLGPPIEGNPFEAKAPAGKESLGEGINYDPTHEMGFMEKLGTGMLNPVVGAVQQITNLASNLPSDPLNALAGKIGLPSGPPSSPQAINQAVTQRQQAIEGQGGNKGIGQTLGEMASPVNIAASMALGPAAAGGVSGLLQPQANYSPQQTAINTGLGMLGGKLAGAVGNKLAGITAPVFDAAKNLLLREGVRLTPGQLTGGTLQRAENALSRIPIAGALPRQAELQAFQDFNRAAINRALAPVGLSLPPDAPPGHAAVKMARDMLSNLYNRVLPRMVGMFDQTLANDFNTIRQMGTMLPPELRGQLERTIKHDVMDKLSQGGGMTGRTAHEIGENLNNLISKMEQSDNPDVRRLSGAIKEVDASVERLMARQNPQLFPVKKQIDYGWANYKIIENAAQKQGAMEGVFTPAQLSNAVRVADDSKDNRAYAHGQALLQDLANAAKKVLPDQLTGSPTAEISMWHKLLTGAGIGGAGYGAAAFPGVTAGGAAVGAGILGAANLPYTRPGLAAINALAQPAGPGRNALAQGFQAAGQYGAVPAGIAATQLSPQQGQ